MLRTLGTRSCVVLIAGLAACGGHPVQNSIYTPYPRNDVFAEVHKKVLDMGYTVQRTDTINHTLVADKAGQGAEREEIQVAVAPDQTGSVKLTVVSARVLPATADRPARRVTASARTNADANALIQLFMTTKGRKTAPPGS